MFFVDSGGRIERGPRVKFERKTPIFSEGDTATHWYRVVEGAVRLSRTLADGHRQVFEILMPGDTFGLELGSTHLATAEAISETAVLKCPRTCVEQPGEEDHNRKIIAMFSRSLSAAQDHIAMLGHQGAKGRVASFLLRLAHMQGRVRSERIAVPVGRQDVADYLGLTLETTCRTLSEFKRHRLISAPSRHELVIHNFSRLEEIAEGAV